MGNSKSVRVAADAADGLWNEPAQSHSKFEEELEKTDFKDWAAEVIAAEKVYPNGEFPGADAQASEQVPATLPSGYETDALVSHRSSVRIGLEHPASIL